MKIKKLDELQLIKKGNVFKHCLFTIIALLILYLYMMNFNIIVISHKNAILFIILFTISLFSIEMICYDIYPLSEKRQKYLIFILALFGIVFITINAYEIIFKKANFIENRLISDVGLGIIIGSLLFSILLTYTIKSVYNKIHKED